MKKLFKFFQSKSVTGDENVEVARRCCHFLSLHEIFRRDKIVNALPCLLVGGGAGGKNWLFRKLHQPFHFIMTPFLLGKFYQSTPHLLLRPSRRYCWSCGVIKETKCKTNELFFFFTETKIGQSSCFENITRIFVFESYCACLVVRGFDSTFNEVNQKVKWWPIPSLEVANLRLSISLL